jgi:hypothetical protein
MSEETVEYLKHARRSGMSSVDAWEDLNDLADEVDWDVERMLSDENTNLDAVSERDSRA